MCSNDQELHKKKHNKIMSPTKASVCDIFDNMAIFGKCLDKLEFRHSLSQIYSVGMFLST